MALLTEWCSAHGSCLVALTQPHHRTQLCPAASPADWEMLILMQTHTYCGTLSLKEMSSNANLVILRNIVKRNLFTGCLIKMPFCIFLLSSFFIKDCSLHWIHVNHSLHFCVMCSKWLNVDILPQCLLDLDKGGNELRFPTTHHSHSSIQSQFTALPLSLLLTLVILPNCSTICICVSFFSLCGVAGSSVWNIPKKMLNLRHLNRCGVGGKSQKLHHWLSTVCNLPHKQNK